MRAGDPAQVQLVAPAVSGSAAPQLDAVQEAAAQFAAARDSVPWDSVSRDSVLTDSVLSDSAAAAMLLVGAPGTGKSTAAVEAVVRAVRSGVPADHCVLLAPSRTMAATLRDQVTTRLQGTSTEPLARTMQAFAWGILRAEAALRGDPPPRLLSGPEQDVVLRDLLAGHAAGDPVGPVWPDSVREALGTRGFRNELRDLLMRAVESSLTADDLARLGREHDRPEWVAAAQVLDEYDQVTALSAPGGYDPSWILGAATDLLIEDDAARHRLHDRLTLIVIDDAQELSPAGARLLAAAAGPGARTLLLADPDATVQGFRGADPAVAFALADRWGAGEALTLGTSYRQGQALREVSARVSSRIGSVGSVRHRETTVAVAPDTTEDHAADLAPTVEVYRSVAAESGGIAATLRRAHLLSGLPWGEMAVIVRGQSRATALRRSLSVAGVPVATAAATLPLRDEPAVRPFLQALELITGDAPPQEDLPGLAVDLLSSAIGSADALVLRRLRRTLRQAELVDGGSRTSDELLVAATLSPQEFAVDLRVVGEPVRRVRSVLDAGRSALAAEAASAEDVLWAMWAASGLAQEWEHDAFTGGPAGTRADRDLDAMVALFSAAALFQDRLPAAPAGAFAEHLRGQDVPGDRLVKSAPDSDQVALLTAQAAAGRSWSLVVVAGVQESVWPDLRLRGSLLGSSDLVDVVTGRGRSAQAAATAVRYDETRQFLVAVSRASHRLIVTAVDNDEEQPSAFLDLIDEFPLLEDRPYAPVPRPMSLAGIVASLRRSVAAGEGSESDAESMATALAWLAEAGVRGADPQQWWPLRDRSVDVLRRPLPLSVRVSPSTLSSFSTCALRWFLVNSGGQHDSATAASLGTLIHDIVDIHGDDGLGAMMRALDERWSALGLPQGWNQRAQRQLAELMLTRADQYLTAEHAVGTTVLGTEMPFEVTIGRADLRGRVDRLESTADGVRVVDFKTGGTSVTQAEVVEHLQLGAYQAALAEGGFDGVSGQKSAGAALVQLGKAAGKTPAAKVQAQAPLDAQEDPQWAQARIAELAEQMADREFIATAGSMCEVCDVQSSCPLRDRGRML